MTPGTDSNRSQPPQTPGAGSFPSELTEEDPPGRRLLLALGVLVLLVSVLPPVATWARRYEFVEAVQISFLAVVVPALLVLGAPWRLLGLAGRHPVLLDDDGAPVPGSGPLKPMDRLARNRRHHPEAIRSVSFALVYMASIVFWRLPGTVDALVRHPWLTVVEAVVLVAVGMGLWLELVESPPLVPRLSRPKRVALAAVSMWIVWVLGYMMAMSRVSWYPAYLHHAGSGLSLQADQQLGTGVMLVVSGCAFIPVVYANLIRWLHTEEDPDEEMQQMLRTERIRGRTLDGDTTRTT